MKRILLLMVGALAVAPAIAQDVEGSGVQWIELSDVASADLAGGDRFLITSSSHLDSEGNTEIVTFWKVGDFIVRCHDKIPSMGDEQGWCYGVGSKSAGGAP
jgi:hypothetical protein